MGTTQRLSSLRGECLVRDRHRCVISRTFDEAEIDARYKINREVGVDDDGNSLVDEEPEFLEVAHIIPRSLTSSKGETMLVRFYFHFANG